MDNKVLKQEEKALLITVLKKHAPNLIEILPKLEAGMVDKDKANEMRDAVGDELMDAGFGPDWDPNKYGDKLEDLIDRLADLYIWPYEEK